MGQISVKIPTAAGSVLSDIQHSRVSDDVVYDVVSALHDQRAALEGIYSAEDREVRFAVESGVPFHAGAERFYREIGMWPPQAQ